MKNTKEKNKAIIIGASIAGLLAARICSKHFKEVIILEKDKIAPDLQQRRGVPQGFQLHILLSKGLEIVSELFPGIKSILKSKGAIAGDLGQHIKWFSGDGFRPQCATGLETVMMSRPLLENTIRALLLKRKNVTLIDQSTFKNFLKDRNTITGVETAEGIIKSDLVIDSRGFASRLLTEIEEMGYQKPHIEKVKVNVKYTSCLFPREADFQTLLNIDAKPPFNSKHGTAQPIENDKMIVMLQGRANDTPPHDIDSFKEYTKALENPMIYEKIKELNPLSEVFAYHIPYVRWIHFEKMEAFPDGLLVLGDAICRLNPVYGQGMTSAAIQATILDKLLSKNGAQSIWKPYFKAVAKEIKSPWELTLSEDFKFPGTEGIPPKMPAFLVSYFNKLNRAMNSDPVIYKPFMKVLNMVSNPTILLRPNIIWRVLKAKKLSKDEPKIITGRTGEAA